MPPLDSPRYVIMSGAFDEGQWGAYQGKAWKLIAWGNQDISCMRLQIGEDTGRGGSSCSDWGTGSGEKEYILSRSYDPGDDQVNSFTYGEVAGEVSMIEFRLTTGDVVTVETVAPPEDLDVPTRYYAVALPYSDNGEIVAFDEAGNELERKSLCPQTCGGRSPIR